MQSVLSLKAGSHVWFRTNVVWSNWTIVILTLFVPDPLFSPCREWMNEHEKYTLSLPFLSFFLFPPRFTTWSFLCIIHPCGFDLIINNSLTSVVLIKKSDGLNNVGISLLLDLATPFYKNEESRWYSNSAFTAYITWNACPTLQIKSKYRTTQACSFIDCQQNRIYKKMHR